MSLKFGIMGKNYHDKFEGLSDVWKWRWSEVTPPPSWVNVSDAPTINGRHVDLVFTRGVKKLWVGKLLRGRSKALSSVHFQMRFKE